MQGHVSLFGFPGKFLSDSSCLDSLVNGLGEDELESRLE